MEILSSPEARLYFALALNALVLWAAWRAARRVNTDRFDAAGDAGLLFYLIQYLSVGIPGLLGILNMTSIAVVAILLSVALLICSLQKGASRSPSAARDPAPTAPASAIVIFGVAAAFVIGYALCLILYQNAIPVISNDAITYHLPAAVQWLQNGRIGLYEAWFYNPANSYSPLGGSVFITWLLAPMGNDVLARYVAAGPLLLLFVALVNLCRRIGSDLGVAGLIAAAAVLARPIISQTALAKDDLFVAAFFILTIDALRRERMSGRIGCWRAGVALGLMLAVKFTAILSLPIIFLVLGRQRKWHWPVVVFFCVVILAGPWYLRNTLWTGNPFYPTRITVGGVTILDGMIAVRRSALLSTPAGVWDVFTGGYYGVPVALAVILIVAWLGGIVIAAKNVWRDPLTRTVIVGPVLGIAIFIALAPYGEMRFAYPSLMLLFVALAMGLSRLPRIVRLILAALIALLAAGTAFNVSVADFLIAGAVGGIIGGGIVAILLKSANARRFAPFAAIACVLALMMYAYVNFKRYVIQCDADSSAAYSDPGAYGTLGDVWRFVREDLPKHITIAYANTYFTYPLMGYAYDDKVVYAPTRAGLDRFIDMPPIEQKITGEQIVARVVALLRENPDRAQWLTRLHASKADYLVIAKKLAETKNDEPPPELKFVAELPHNFVKLFENDAGVVYKIRK